MQCVNTIGGHSCQCANGFEAFETFNFQHQSFETKCRDIDECRSRLSCPYKSVCKNVDGSYTCECETGFEVTVVHHATYQSEECADIDECSEETVCDRNAACLNTEGTYHCSCNPGFYGSGQKCDRGQCSDASCPENEKCVSPTTTKCECLENYARVDEICKDVNECDLRSTCDENALCENLPGGYMCSCLSGFHGNGTLCEFGNCKDELCSIDEECSSPTGVCHCKKGYNRDANSSCIDDDECIINPCDDNAECSNSPGSFYCDCSQGFYGSGETCVAGQCVDESCPANQICKSNTSVCYCPENFALVDDVCTDVDECLHAYEYCPRLSACVNEDGGYVCNCYVGYGGSNCSNIDECAINNHTCLSSQTCIDTIGSFDCECADGYNFKNGTCQDRDECRMNSTLCGSLYCVNLPGSYLCQEKVHKSSSVLKVTR